MSGNMRHQWTSLKQRSSRRKERDKEGPTMKWRARLTGFSQLLQQTGVEISSLRSTVCPLSKLQVYNSILLTISSLCCILDVQTYLFCITETLSPLIISSFHTPTTNLLIPSNHHSILDFYKFDYFKFHI